MAMRTDPNYIHETCVHETREGIRCGHIWVPKGVDYRGRVVRPWLCPKCKCKHEPSGNLYQVLTCRRKVCGRQWVRRTVQMPMKCPGCGNPYWRKAG